jgi:ADP-ribose pyrophosphatase YjhB (NUDIX family)
LREGSGGTPSRLQAELRGAPVLQYLLICRKDTIGFIEFMRGKYAINNRAYIQNLISEMTLLEKQRLLDNDFLTLWYNLWGDCVSNQFRSEEKNARDKFDALKEGINVGNSINSFFSLQTLVNSSETKWTEPEWGFPKGRHNNLEKDLNCGLREFEEETGYPSHCVKVVQNVMPYEEIFTGSNYKSYKHKYYLGQIDILEKPKRRHQETEISKVEWCTYERALELIRPYNVEKLAVLEKVNKVLTKYTTF